MQAHLARQGEDITEDGTNNITVSSMCMSVEFSIFWILYMPDPFMFGQLHH